jgi:hypothetical protein
MTEIFDRHDGSALYLIENLGGRVDVLPPHYLDRLALAITARRRQQAAQKRRERARAKK